MVVTPYGENELYPSDIHINQNPGGRDFGLQKWIDRDANVENKDIVLWPSFGMTRVSRAPAPALPTSVPDASLLRSVLDSHFARPEDWPIMPVEIVRAHLKPSGFFDVRPLPHLLSPPPPPSRIPS